MIRVLMHVLNKNKDPNYCNNRSGYFRDYELSIGYHWSEYIIVEMLEDKSEIWLDYYPG